MQITCHFEFGSPYTYLAWHRMQHPRYDAVLWRPMSLYHIAKQEGGRLNKDLPNMARYNFHDLRRTAKAYGAPFWFPKSFPANTMPAHRAHFLAEEQGLGPRWRKAVFLAHWSKDEDIGDMDTLQRLADGIGLDLSDLDMKKQDLVDATVGAYEAGACGAPFFIVDGEPFWGHDRLDWVEARMDGREAPDWIMQDRSS